MKLNNVDLNKIAVFSQVIESGNYQRASEILNVTPSALSQTISSLEASLGLKLFDRHGKRLSVTARGLKLHREFRQYNQGFLRALAELQDESAKISGVLRIGAYLEFAKSQLTTVIREFVDHFPEAQIKMTFATPSRLHRMLASGQLDLCFSIYPANESKAITSQKVYQEELVLIAPHHLLPATPTYTEILKTPVVEYYLNHQPIRRWLNLHFQKRPKKIPVRILAATAEMVLALVEDGGGIGVVPAYLVRSGELQIVRPTNKRLTDYIWLLERSAPSTPALQQRFKERFLERRQQSL